MNTTTRKVLIQYVIPTAITVIGSVIVAAIAALGTIRTAESRISKIQEQAETLDDLSRLPVGTVITSLLPPKQFAALVGDPSNYDQQKSRWVFADDRGKMPGTQWAQLTDNAPIPDLRGMFLRGINHGRTDGKQDPKGERNPGDYEEDQIGPHSHKYQTAGIWHRSFKGEDGSPKTATASAGQTDTNTASETRPRNIAVYYYIRVR